MKWKFWYMKLAVVPIQICSYTAVSYPCSLMGTRLMHVNPVYYSYVSERMCFLDEVSRMRKLPSWWPSSTSAASACAMRPWKLKVKCTGYYFNWWFDEWWNYMYSMIHKHTHYKYMYVSVYMCVQLTHLPKVMHLLNWGQKECFNNHLIKSQCIHKHMLQ